MIEGHAENLLGDLVMKWGMWVGEGPAWAHMDEASTSQFILKPVMGSVSEAAGQEV